MPAPLAESNVHFLVVEDDPGMRSALRDLLIEAEFAPRVGVEEAASFEEAAEALGRRQFDLLLLDHRLASGKTGLDVLAAARARGIQTPAIVITGLAQEDLGVEAMKAGAVDYLPKANLTPDSIRRSVGRALELAEKEGLRREAERKLRESEERHRALLENSYDAISLIDREGTILYASPATTRLLGYRLDDFVGKDAFGFIHPNDLEETRALFAQCIAVPGRVVRGEYRMRHLDGSWWWMEGIATNRLDDPGIEAVIANFRDVTERKASDAARRTFEEQIHYQAFHDALTGLPNRSLFEDRLALAIAHADRNAEGLCVMFLDVDHFKAVNDSHGHDVGDGVLRTVANRLRGCIREHDSVARIGGDEFLLLFPELGDRDDAERVARKLLRQLSRPFSMRALSLVVTASVGIALYRIHGTTSEELLKSADAAMYSAKAMGRNRSSFLRRPRSNGPSAIDPE